MERFKSRSPTPQDPKPSPPASPESGSPTYLCYITSLFNSETPTQTMEWTSKIIKPVLGKTKKEKID